MKKFNMYKIAVALLFSCLLISCGSKNDQLLGKWQLVEVEDLGRNEKMPDELLGETLLTINKDGVYYLQVTNKQGEDIDTGSWVLEENSMKMLSKNTQDTSLFQQVQYSADSLSWIWIPRDSIRFKFARR